MAFKLRSHGNSPLAQEKPKAKRSSFDEWYKTVPATKNDTTSYNLRRAYELAPKKELDWFNSKDSEATQFRKNYKLDTSGEYYKYVPKTNKTKLK